VQWAKLVASGDVQDAAVVLLVRTEEVHLQILELYHEEGLLSTASDVGHNLPPLDVGRAAAIRDHH